VKASFVLHIKGEIFAHKREVICSERCRAQLARQIQRVANSGFVVRLSKFLLPACNQESVVGFVAGVGHVPMCRLSGAEPLSLRHNNQAAGREKMGPTHGALAQ
jgi:hypothetical protein